MALPKIREPRYWRPLVRANGTSSIGSATGTTGSCQHDNSNHSGVRMTSSPPRCPTPLPSPDPRGQLDSAISRSISSAKTSSGGKPNTGMPLTKNAGVPLTPNRCAAASSSDTVFS